MKLLQKTDKEIQSLKACLDIEIEFHTQKIKLNKEKRCCNFFGLVGESFHGRKVKLKIEKRDFLENLSNIIAAKIDSEYKLNAIKNLKKQHPRACDGWFSRVNKICNDVIQELTAAHKSENRISY